MKTSAAFSNPEAQNETGSFFNPCKIFYGTCIPEFILENDRLTSTEKLTYAVLAKFAEKDGRCCPSYQEIADRIQKTKRHTVRVINSLAEKGVIVRSISGNVVSYYFVFHLSLFGNIDASADDVPKNPDTDKTDSPKIRSRVKTPKGNVHDNDDLRKIPDVLNNDTTADDRSDDGSVEKKNGNSSSPVKTKAVPAKKRRAAVKKTEKPSSPVKKKPASAKKRRVAVKKTEKLSSPVNDESAKSAEKEGHIPDAENEKEPEASSLPVNDESVSAKSAEKEGHIPDVENEKKPEASSLPVNDESAKSAEEEGIPDVEKEPENPPLPPPDDNSSSARRRRRRAATEDPDSYKSAAKKMRQREFEDAIKEREKLSSPAEEIKPLPPSAPEYQSPSIDLSELPEAVIQLNDLCDEIDGINMGKRKFNPYQFVQHALQQNSHAEAIIYTLKGLILFWHEDDTLAGDDIWKMGLSLLVSCRRHHNRYDEDRDRKTKDSWNELMRIPHFFRELVSKSGKEER